MKKAIVLLFIGVLMIIPAITTAETMVEKINLPVDYTSWPESLEQACGPDANHVYKISSYGRYNSTTNMVEFIKVRSGNGLPIYIWYEIRIASNPDLPPYNEQAPSISRGYFPNTKNGWIELDLKTYDSKKVPSMLGAMIEQTLNMTEKNLMKLCRPIEDASWRFYNSLHKNYEE